LLNEDGHSLCTAKIPENSWQIAEKIREKMNVAAMLGKRVVIYI